MTFPDGRRWSVLLAILLVSLLLSSCTASVPPAPTPSPTPAAPSGRPGVAGVDPVPSPCQHPRTGPTQAPPGAVPVDPAVVGDLIDKTRLQPAGTTFWLAPGTHTLGGDLYTQVAPKAGDTYIGAPGAVVDGRGINQYAFTERAENVTIRFLTVRGFVAPQDQGVVNHDSGDGWKIEDSTIELNSGAGLMAGARQQVRDNCLRNNGQYGMNAYQAGDGIVGLVVEGNEIVGNNTGDWERKVPGCGCSGGVKFWAVDGADVVGNWIHDNRSVGLWADTNNNDFLIANNVIEGNDSEAVFYETSYNLVLRDNKIQRNTFVKGKEFLNDRDNFPVGAVYLSESGGEPRVKARTDKIEIYGNEFVDNWSGVTAWENADRFCNSPSNTSTGYCTRLVPKISDCAQPAVAKAPLYDDCRWKTQRLDVHDNTFTQDSRDVACAPGFSTRMAILSNFGTYPDWSPFKGTVVQRAITENQDNVWHDNRYTGDWMFVLANGDRSIGLDKWQAEPFGQDKGSTFTPAPGSCGGGS